MSTERITNIYETKFHEIKHKYIWKKIYLEILLFSKEKAWISHWKYQSKSIPFCNVLSFDTHSWISVNEVYGLWIDFPWITPDSYTPIHSLRQCLKGPIESICIMVGDSLEVVLQALKQ